MEMYFPHHRSSCASSPPASSMTVTRRAPATVIRRSVRRFCRPQRTNRVGSLRPKKGAQLRGAVGGVADELFQAGAQAAGVAGQPLGQELQQFGEFGRVDSVEPYFGHGVTPFRGRVAWAL